MKIRLTNFKQHKDGYTEAEYEDAACPEPGVYAAGVWRGAVADGASEGMLSKQWAELLVKSYAVSESNQPQIEAQTETPIESLLTTVDSEWQLWLQSYLRQREEENRPVQWFEEPGLQAGAFATFLGLTLAGADETGSWRALAVGDSCLFQVRENRVTQSFPLSRSDEFNNHPHLFLSDPLRRSEVVENARQVEGRWQTGDEFFLMTDALACWSLRQLEAGLAPWSELRSLTITGNEESTREWLAAVRASKEMRNDDVTLMRLELI